MCGVVIFWCLQNYFQEKGCFCAECARYTFWKMIFAKTRFALSVSKSWSHILLSLKTTKIKVKLNHKITPSTFESMPHLDFQKQLCHRETDRDLLSFSPVSLNDPTEQKYV